MNTKFVFKFLSALIVIILLLGAGIPGGVQRASADDIGNILAWPQNGSVELGNCPLFDEFTLTVFDGTNTVYRTLPIPCVQREDGYHHASFQVVYYRLKLGDIVTVSNGTVSKELVITPEGTHRVDVMADTIQGVNPGATHLGVVASGYWLDVNATEDGSWLADFSGKVDLVPGMSLGVYQDDGDGDFTGYTWDVPNPKVRMWLGNNQQSVAGYEWPVGDEVSLTIFYDETRTVKLFGPVTQTADYWGNLGFTIDGFEVLPGMLLEMTNGTITKEHVVLPVAVTEGSSGTDYFAGTASPSRSLGVCVWNEIGCGEAFADANGNWRADYAASGVDILPGTGVNADQYDEDGDGTSFSFVLPAPMIAVNPTWDVVSASGMPIGTMLTLTIKEDGQQVFQSDPTPIDQNPNDPNDISARFDLKGFDVKPGQELNVNFGDDSIRYTVTNFQITNIDLVGDKITGIATPYATMQICVNLADHCAMRYPVADGNGDWTADFGNPSTPPNEQDIADIQPGSNGWGNEHDAQWRNQTWAAWNVPNPRFEVRPNIDQVRGWEWNKGANLTLEIGGQSFTGVVGETSWDPNQSYIEFNLAGTYDIQPGDNISLSDGVTAKDTTVTELAFTEIDIVTDIVTGKATRGLRVDLWAWDGATNINRHVVAGEDGFWSADFSSVGSGQDEQSTVDILPGTWVDSQQVDGDGDATMFGQNAPTPIFVVNPTGHWAYAWDWPANEVLTMTIGEGGIPIYATTNPTGPFTSEAFFDLTGVELTPGIVVVVEGAGINKSLVVTGFSVELDVLNNILSGTASPQGGVFACADNAPGNCRFATAVDGQWSMLPDPEGFVLVPGVFGWAAEGDEDGDMTRMDWWVPLPTRGSAVGEGWFDSPSGAYTADPAFAGKAAIEFAAKYSKKTEILSGNVQFSIKKFSFTSTAIDWLVIENGRMQLTGLGKINGKAGYSFVLNVAKNPPGLNDQDTIHIRIWETSTENVIYDNMPGEPDYVMPVAPLHGGGITLTP
jgi:hypothetical protein